MQDYAVHLYTTVRVRVTGVRAESAAYALAKAAEAVDLHHLLDRHHLNSGSAGLTVTDVEYAEGPIEWACVDPLLPDGQVHYDASTFLEHDGTALIDGKTAVERSAERCEQAQAYLAKLLAAPDKLASSGSNDSQMPADLLQALQDILEGRAAVSQG